MKNKTCGECKHLNRELAFCRACGAKWLNENDGASCKYFEKLTPPTNGDRIRQGSDKELVLYKHTWSCEVCIYHDKKDLKKHCKRPHEKVCLDGMIAWLNAPAGTDNNVPAKESEVKDE